MIRPALIIVLLGIACGCAEAPLAIRPIEFLTRSGCVQTTTMRARLDAAIAAIGKPLPYVVVDLDSLPATDVRKAYPTPTVLYGRADLFGMEEPKPPYPEPT